MSKHYTTGRWTVSPGNADAFVEAWETFAAWASGKPGAGALMLTRDVDAPELFVSVGGWETLEAIRSWKGSPEFRERIAHVLQHVSEFESKNLALLVTAEGGASNVRPD
jgi:heme-degrading monooxygenase HmoA